MLVSASQLTFNCSVIYSVTSWGSDVLKSTWSFFCEISSCEVAATFCGRRLDKNLTMSKLRQIIGVAWTQKFSNCSCIVTSLQKNKDIWSWRLIWTWGQRNVYPADRSRRELLSCMQGMKRFQSVPTVGDYFDMKMCMWSYLTMIFFSFSPFLSRCLSSFPLPLLFLSVCPWTSFPPFLHLTSLSCPLFFFFLSLTLPSSPASKSSVARC